MNKSDYTIVWPVGDGVAVFHPADDCPLSLDALAAAVVPAGQPFKVVAASELPDRAFRNAWESDFTDSDGVGATFGDGTDIDYGADRNGNLITINNGVVESPVVPTVAIKQRAGEIVENLAKAKEIAHSKRREKRAEDLAPLDAELNQVRGRSAAAINIDKEAILLKYDLVQAKIDAATTVDELKAIISW